MSKGLCLWWMGCIKTQRRYRQIVQVLVMIAVLIELIDYNKLKIFLSYIKVVCLNIDVKRPLPLVDGLYKISENISPDSSGFGYDCCSYQIA